MTTIYLINRIPSRRLRGKSPFVLAFHKQPSLGHLRVLVPLLCNKPQKHDKFSPKEISTVLLGYFLVKKGYKLFDLHNNWVFVSREVIFKEDELPFKGSFPTSLSETVVVQHSLIVPFH